MMLSSSPLSRFPLPDLFSQTCPGLEAHDSCGWDDEWLARPRVAPLPRLSLMYSERPEAAERHFLPFAKLVCHPAEEGLNCVCDSAPGLGRL